MVVDLKKWAWKEISKSLSGIAWGTMLQTRRILKVELG
jgi:hypothetical protein